jgi:hypothetical protein
MNTVNEIEDQWMIRGVTYVNCICAWGCPCQFSSPSSYGRCEGMASGHIEEGHFNDTKLDGLNMVHVAQMARRDRGGRGHPAGDHRRARGRRPA